MKRQESPWLQPGEYVNGIILSSLIGFLGYKKKSLSPSGVVGGVLIGTLVIGCGGWIAGVLLFAFFASSSLLSHFREAQKHEVAAEKFSKGGERDFGQAFANGGVVALIAIAGWLYPSSIWQAAIVGALAAVNADTWATELGVLNSQPPRLITTGRVVPAGTSGGISALGTGAALMGATFIGVIAWILAQLPTAASTITLRSPTIILIAALAGLASALFDSLLGATVQRTYYCEHCHKETERIIHSCGNTTHPLRGWSWLNNDVVNFLASIVGAGRRSVDHYLEIKLPQYKTKLARIVLRPKGMQF